MTASDIDAFIETRRNLPRISSQWDHTAGQWTFLRQSSPASWGDRIKVKRSWLELLFRIAAIAGLCAGAYLIWGK
jgi:hypothetical protein